ncbi:MAG: alpha/beta hydrolase [Flavobacteriaceae bacterium]|nr:alpha/beta hydrolase [Flavobacteriaceae bacterium]
MKYEKKLGKKREIIICIHGNSSSPRVFDWIIENSGLPYSFVNVELMAHGSSGKQSYLEGELGLANCLEKLTNLVNSFDEDVILVGHGLGGHLAIGISPEVHRLKGMLLAGTPPLKKPVNIAEAFMPSEFLECFFKPDYCDFELSKNLGMLTNSKQHQELIVQDFKNTLPEVRKNVAENLFQNRWANEYDIVMDGTTPIYFVQGDKDPVISKDYLQQIVQEASAHCQLFVIPQSAHFVMLDNPDAYMDILGKLVQKVFV